MLSKKGFEGRDNGSAHISLSRYFFINIQSISHDSRVSD